MTSLWRGESRAAGGPPFSRDFARALRWTRWPVLLVLASACAGPGGRETAERPGSIGVAAEEGRGRAADQEPVPRAGAARSGASEFARRLSGSDLVHVDVWLGPEGGTHARIEYFAEKSAGTARPVAPGNAVEVGDAKVSVLYSYPPSSLVPGDGAAAGRDRVLMSVTPLEPPSSPSAFVDALLGELRVSDRAGLSIHGRGMGHGSLTLPARAMGFQRLAARAAFTSAKSHAAATGDALPATAPFQELGNSGDGEDRGDASREAFLRFLEFELLQRRPAAAADTRIAAALSDSELGGLFLAGQGSFADAEEDAAVRALPAVLYAIHAMDSGTIPVESVGTDGWAVPRFLALRERMGPDAFRAMLRTLTDPRRGPVTMDFDQLAGAAEAAAPGLGARWARAWLLGPARPSVKTQWRHDAARGRVLLRVDQLHDLAGGRAVPAFPFRLPVRLVLPGGGLETHLLEIDKRRDLLEIPSELAPLEVQIDPEDRLGELVDFQVSDSAR